MVTRRILIGLALSMVVFVGGCSEPTDHEGEITALITAFYEEGYNGDLEKAFAMLDAESQARCPFEEFKKSQGLLANLRLMTGITIRVDRVEDIVVEGDLARAKVYTTNGEPRYYWPEPPDSHFTREKGQWRYYYDSDCVTWEWTDYPNPPRLPQLRPTSTPARSR